MSNEWLSSFEYERREFETWEEQSLKKKEEKWKQLSRGEKTCVAEIKRERKKILHGLTPSVIGMLFLKNFFFNIYFFQKNVSGMAISH